MIIAPALLSALTIDEAIYQTINTNPQMSIKKAELNTENELLTSAKSGYLPSIDLSYSIGPETTQTIANFRKDVAVTRQEASATLTQNLFTGFDTMNGVEQQEARISSAGNSVADSANSIALETATAYINLLRNKEFLNISKENVEVHKKYLDQIQESVDAGVGRSSDAKQTLSRYENAQSVYHLSKQNYDNSISSFQRLLPVDLQSNPINKPTIGKLPVDNLEELTNMALLFNPLVHVSESDLRFAEAALRRSNAPYYPKLDVVAQAYWNQGLNGIPDTARYDEASGYNALLVLSYNIFNGLNDSANKEANRYRLVNQQSTLADSKRYIEAFTQIAWQTYNSTQTQLIHIDRNIMASAETVAAYQEEHSLGRRSIIDLLNIELEYNAAKNRKVTAEYDRILAYYQILTHTGKMLETMNVTLK